MVNLISDENEDKNDIKSRLCKLLIDSILYLNSILLASIANDMINNEKESIEKISEKY